MGEEKSEKSNEKEPRKVLGDVTNQSRKREFSLISRSPTKRKVRDKQTANDDDSDSNFWKQVAIVIEKLEKENRVPKSLKIGHETGLSPLKGGKIYRLQNNSSDSKKGVLISGREVKDPGGGSGLDSIVLDGANVAGETVKRGSVSGVNVGESSKRDGGESGKERGDETIVLSNVVEGDGSVEILGTQGVSEGGKTLSFGADCALKSKSESQVASDCGRTKSGGVDCVLKSKSEPQVATDCGRTLSFGVGCVSKSKHESQFVSDSGRTKSFGVDCVPKSKSKSHFATDCGRPMSFGVDCALKSKHEAQFVSDSGRTKSVGVDCALKSKAECQEKQGFALERCTLLKGDDGANVGAEVESIKHCSCSFCTKAAFIWSDLHYQDMKGRLSVLAKSQKEASNLAQKYNVEDDMGKHVQGTNVNQLEVDLTSQWRSLFFQMEDMYGNEGSQLQSNFHALKDIRDDYKSSLETLGMPSDVLQCSSDASDHTS